MILYALIVDRARPFHASACEGFDLGFIDGIVNGIGHFVSEVGNLARQVQVGFVRSYAAVIMLGAVVVIGYFIYYGLKLVG